jgi:ribonuclease Y
MEILTFILLVALSLVLYQVFIYYRTNKELSQKLNGFEEKERSWKNDNNKITKEYLDEKESKLSNLEKKLIAKEQKLIERDTLLDEKFDKVLKKEKDIESKLLDIDKKSKDIDKRLEDISNLTKEEAKQQLMSIADEELKTWKSRKIKDSENEINFEIEKKAKNILVENMLNAATDYVAETSTTTITINDENLKGKLIGKEGRNIRTFERLTGVDLIVDEAPNQVTVSCFDPIRREVAAMAIKKLLSDGRVHPGSIEETIEKVKKDVLKEIKKTGEEITYETGLNNLPNDIIMFLGRFKYRFSYGQNLVSHTLEVVKIGESLATDLKANTKIVKLACLLHDIGKVIPEEGKQHHHISGEITRKYFPNDEILANAVEAHHFDIEAKSIEAEIVRIADAISGARPGARRDNYEDYVKRIRALEDISLKQAGVKEAYAIHAGREIRVILKADETTDEDTSLIAYNISKEIEETQKYPGIIKVTVIREVRKTVDAK